MDNRTLWIFLCLTQASWSELRVREAMDKEKGMYLYTAERQWKFKGSKIDEWI